MLCLARSGAARINCILQFNLSISNNSWRHVAVTQSGLLRQFRNADGASLRKSGSRRNGRSASLREMFGDEEERQRLEEEAELIEDWVGNEIETSAMAHEKDDIARVAEQKHREMIKRKIIEHKYFRPPQETNLLTWAAKEQIRYLHNENPEDWNVERLSQCFPVSVEGVRKILRSSYCPKSSQEVVKHDKRVHRRWLELMSGKSSKYSLPAGVDSKLSVRTDGGGPLAALPQWLLNAAGNPSLPAPDPLKFDRDRKKQPGRFEAIVKDYCEAKATVHYESEKTENNKVKLISSVKRLHELPSGSDKILSKKITENVKKMNDKYTVGQSNMLNTKTNSKFLDSVAKRNVDKRLQVGNSNFSRKSTIISDLQAERPDDENCTVSLTSTLIDASFEQCNKKMDSWDNNRVSPNSSDLNAKELSENPGVLLQNSASSSHQKTVVNGNFDYGMEGKANRRTEKAIKMNKSRSISEELNHLPSVSNANVSNATINSMNESFNNGQNTYQTPHCRDYVSNQKSIGQTPKSSQEKLLHDPDKNETYIYDEVQGYLYPFGRNSDLPKERLHIRMSPSSKGQSGLSSVTHRKGNDVYDVDGEFLYRIP